jgi:actin-related protein
MFENYEMAGVYIAIQAVLTLYAQGTVLYIDRFCSGGGGCEPKIQEGGERAAV